MEIESNYKTLEFDSNFLESSFNFLESNYKLTFYNLVLDLFIIPDKLPINIFGFT